MGVVYEVSDAHDGRRFALKTLSHVDADGIYRLKNEFRALADVSHPNLVRLHELLVDGDHWFFTMDLVAGMPFSTFVRSGVVASPRDASSGIALRSGARREGLDAEGSGSFEEAVLRDALMQLATGVLAIHAAGKLHRDLKPSNVLIADGRVVILDFGLVSETSGDGSDQASGYGLMGTPHYMAPEQARGERATVASDWYAVGVMLFESLTGRLPFEGSVSDVLMGKLLHGAPPPSQFADVPEDLNALCVDLLQRDPARRPGATEILRRVALESGPSMPPRAEVAVLPFVGREREQSVLRDAFAETEGAIPVVALVTGTSGMGKTALVDRFLQRLERTDAVVLSGRCYPREAVPFKVFDGVVDSLSRYLRRLPLEQAGRMMPRHVDALARMFPVLTRVAAVDRVQKKNEPASEPIELRRKSFAALKELLARIVDLSPVVLRVDDLQWGDPDSVLLLRELVGPPDPPALFVVGTYRSDEVQHSQFLRELLLGDRRLSGVEVRTLALDPLTAAEVGSLADALGVSSGAVDAAAIHRESGGNPYFAIELLQQALAGVSALTPSLDQAIRGRLDALAPEARRLVDVVAVAGRPIKRKTAAGICNVKAIGDVLDDLRPLNLLRPIGAGPDALLETYHDRVRDSVMANLGPGALLAWHRSIGEALEAEGAFEVDSVVEHYLAAGEYARAARHAFDAAERAGKVLAFERAAMLYRIAIDHGPATGKERLSLFVRLGEALANAGHNGEAGQTYLEACLHGPEDERRRLRARAVGHLLLGGRIDQGVRLIEDALLDHGIAVPADPAARIEAALAINQELLERGFDFEPRDAASLPTEQVDRVDLLGACARGLIGVAVEGESVFLALCHLREALALGEPERVVRALGSVCIHAPFPWAFELASRAAKRCFELAQTNDDPSVRVWTAFVLGFGHLWQGNYREAAECLCYVDEIWSAHGVGVARDQATVRILIFFALWNSGGVAEILRRMPAWIREADERGDTFQGVQFRLHPVLQLAADKPDVADAEMRRALRRWGRSAFDIPAWIEALGRAQLSLYSARGSAAWQAMDGVWARLFATRLPTNPAFGRVSHSIRALAALGAAAQSQERAAFFEIAEEGARQTTLFELPGRFAISQLIRAGIAELKGELEAAREGYRAAASEHDSVDPIVAAACRAREGRLLGGESGGALVEAAYRFLGAHGIRNPSAWCRMYTPAALADAT